MSAETAKQTSEQEELHRIALEFIEEGYATRDDLERLGVLSERAEASAADHRSAMVERLRERPSGSSSCAEVEGPLQVRPSDDGFVGIAVMDPGAVPRKELRYRLSADQRGKFAIVTRVELAAGDRGFVAMPPVRVEFDYHVVSASRVDFVSTRVLSLPFESPAVDRVVQDNLDGFALELSVQLDELGRICGGKYSVSPAARERASSLAGDLVVALEGLLPAVPPQAVGVGATWEVAARRGGRSRRTLYRLAVLEPERFEVVIQTFGQDDAPVSSEPWPRAAVVGASLEPSTHAVFLDRGSASVRLDTLPAEIVVNRQALHVQGAEVITSTRSESRVGPSLPSTASGVAEVGR